MNTIGISAFTHESACCLLRDGQLVAAAEEERFTRRKHDRSLPVQSFRYCLRHAGLDLTDIDCLAYFEDPTAKLGRQIWSCAISGRGHQLELYDPRRPLREIRGKLGYEGPIEVVEHHLSHAAHAYYSSGTSGAAILTVDGVGEWATTTFARGRDGVVETLDEVLFPDSLGLLYSAITSYLGFRVNSDEYKVMGLAAHGTARFRDAMSTLVRITPEGHARLSMEYFDFLAGKRMYSDALPRLMGGPARRPDEDLTEFHMDVAASLQATLEWGLVETARALHRLAPFTDLCLGGGVALNCRAVKHLREHGPFETLFVPPGPGDSGSCAGAARIAELKRNGVKWSPKRLPSAALGPGYTSAGVHELLVEAGAVFGDFRNNEDGLLDEVARLLDQGRTVGWFQGRMEFGPRALGSRSILADPRDAGMRDHLNRVIKKRETFRPFAPSVLEEVAPRFFDMSSPAPFMSETFAVRTNVDLPAITHADGTARVQTVDPVQSPRFAKLLRRFGQLTDCPVLVNTSFNVAGEPIVCTPEDALRTFLDSGLDVLCMEDFLLEQSGCLTTWRELRPEGAEEDDETPPADVYTFI